MALLAPLRARADVLIDTRAMTPHDLARRDGAASSASEEARGGLAVTLQSFSYKRGVPRGVDMVIDVRFLRIRTGTSTCARATAATRRSRAFVEADPGLRALLRPAGRPRDASCCRAYRAEGKSYFGLGLGCTGGKHRSVVLVEALAKSLAADGWQVSIRHRDLERTDGRGRDRSGVGIA